MKKARDEMSVATELRIIYASSSEFIRLIRYLVEEGQKKEAYFKLQMATRAFLFITQTFYLNFWIEFLTPCLRSCLDH